MKTTVYSLVPRLSANTHFCVELCACRKSGYKAILQQEVMSDMVL